MLLLLHTTTHPTLTRNPQLQIGLGYWNEIWSVFVAPCDIRLTIQLSTLWFFGMQSAVEPTVERALEPAMHSICNQLCTLFIPLSPRHPRKRHRGKQPTSPALPSNYYRTSWNTNVYDNNSACWRCWLPIIAFALNTLKTWRRKPP